MKRRKLRSRSGRAPVPSKYMFLISLLIFLGLTFQTFYYVEKNIEPVLHNIARVRAEQLATKAIHDAINQKIMKETDFKKLMDVREDKDGKIQAAFFNSNEHTRIVFEATENVMHALKEMEGMSETVPLGQALQSNLLAQMGPDLPLKLVPLGSVHVELKPKMQEAGINMVLMTMYMNVEAKVKIVIPFSTQPAVVRTEMPISNALIVGNVPQFYYDSVGRPIGSEVPGVQPPPIVPPIGMSSTTIEK
ncbi:sporulation protein YunB [Aneurinibacillus migulanus]|uniref:sporulation protein YunB n=1 Tax=Aneurinibacillus migulanus TaxID=47500 RepID=UPI002E1CF04C|nr:sporulation protein YunB [Aneurinibacillus migulanus]MED4729249.1 sporulation protein YunB [Aneurinibacillus migulanus]